MNATVNADTCIFVGETLNLDCATDDGTGLDILDFDDNFLRVGNFSITSTIDNVDDVNGTFQCSLANIEGPCGMATRPFSVRVFGECNDACCQSF